MTKSHYQKRKDLEGRTQGFIAMDKRMFADADKGFLFADSKRNEMLRHCHKNIIIHPGELNEGDIVCLMKVRPKKVRRRKYKFSTWKVTYMDRGNGFVQLGNSDTFDKEGAEENIAFLRTHHFDITDTFDLASAFTLFFLPRLKVFIESTRWGIPGNLYLQYIDAGHSEEEATKLAAKEWEDILVRIYEGLTLSFEGPDAEEIRARLKKEHGLTNQKQLWDVENKMEEDAQKLFCEHFFSLWD